jgi:glycopeptide antibiotics resistance protein
MNLYNKKKYGRQRKMILFVCFICVLAIFYYSWVPDARFEKEAYLPWWLRNWSNTYFNLRTAVPFLPLGFLLEAYASIRTRFFIFKSDSPFRIRTTLIALVVICLAEGGQFFVLDRHPDSTDVAFALLGSSCGSVPHYFFKNFNQLFSTKNA